jgi:hypothetical protein
MSYEEGAVRIRNQRYRGWFDILTFMLIGMAVFGAFGMLFDKRMAYFIAAGLLGLVPIVLYALLQVWDLRRPAPGRLVTVRMVFEWLVLGMRRKVLGPADGTTAPTLFRGLLGSVYSVDQLNLGEEFAVADGIIRYPPQAVKQIRFTPDPLEDYGGAEAPLQMCEATVAMDFGKQFRLIVTEADATKLRHWAAANGVIVCDCDGYRPRTPEPATG